MVDTNYDIGYIQYNETRKGYTMTYLTVLIGILTIPLFMGWLNSNQVDPNTNPAYYI